MTLDDTLHSDSLHRSPNTTTAFNLECHSERPLRSRSGQAPGVKNPLPGWQFVTENEILSFGFPSTSLRTGVASRLRMTNCGCMLGTCPLLTSHFESEIKRTVLYAQYSVNRPQNAMLFLDKC